MKRIQNAWGLIKQLQADGTGLVITIMPHRIVVSNFTDEGLPCSGWNWDDEYLMAEAPTLEQAICLWFEKFQKLTEEAKRKEIP